MRKVGFIGVGIMGKPMVRNLLKAGFEVHIFARSMVKVTDVVRDGARFHNEIGECVKDCDVVITIVGYPKDVEEVYFSSGGIFDSAKQGAYLIDMTTTSPALAVRLNEEGTKRGFHVMDAPVTGGDAGAKNGTLSIMVGGDKEDFDVCLPLFRAMGTNINYEGQAGFGQHTKLANQIMIAGTLSGVCEAIAYGKAKGLNLGMLLKSTSSGAAASRQLETLGPKIMENNFAPGFMLKHLIKDMGLASEEAGRNGLKLDILDAVLANCKELEAGGDGDLGTQALIKHYVK